MALEAVGVAVGVVPLGVGLLNFSQELQAIVSTYRDAEKDLESLIRYTNTMRDVCSHLRRYEPTTTNSLLRDALDSCEKDIAEMHAEIEKVTKRKKRGKMSLLYVFKKPDLAKSLSSLNTSIGGLQTCINACTFTSYVPRAPSSQPTEVVEEPYVSESPAYTAETTNPPPPPYTEEELPLLPLTKHRNALYPFSAVYTPMWHQGNVENHGGQLVDPHLLGNLFQRGWLPKSASPLSMIIDTQSYILEESNKKLYDLIKSGPSGSSVSLEDAAKWFESLKIPARTEIVSLRGQKMSVLGAMLTAEKDTAFEYLRNRVRNQMSDQQHLFHMVLQHKPRGETFIKLAKSYLQLRGDAVTPQELVYIVHLDKSPRYFASIVETVFDLLKSRSEDWNMFMFFNECYLIHIICGDSTEDFDPIAWASCAAKLSFTCPKLTIREVNVVIPTWPDPSTGEPAMAPASSTSVADEAKIAPPKFSSLQLHLTSDRTYPVEAIEQAERWLWILVYAGRDVNRYLDQELEEAQQFPFSDPTFQKPDNWADMTRRGKLQAIFDCLRPGKRLAPEDGTTDNLLEILPAFRYWHRQKSKPRSGVWIYDFGKRNWIKTADQENHKPEREWSNNCEASDWKDLRANSDFALNSWPMCWDITTSPMITNRVKYMGEGYARYRDIVDMRFERRQSRKLRAMGKGREVKGAKATIKLGPVTKTWWQSFVGS